MGIYSDLKKAALPATASIVITRLLENDAYADQPDIRDDGFWPSRDEKSAGYVAPEHFEEALAAAKKRMAGYESGAWTYIGVRAKAFISIPIGHGSICTYMLKSAGVWGIESDSEESYLQEVFEDQGAELLEHIKQFAGACENVTIK